MSDVEGWVAPGFERVRETVEAMSAPWGTRRQQPRRRGKEQVTLHDLFTNSSGVLGFDDGRHE